MSNYQSNGYARNNEHSKVANDVSIYIENVLNNVPVTLPKHTIFKVRRQLREVNKKAYDPEILAIGPYHHGNNKFKFMEEQKRRYLKRLLERKGQSVYNYMQTLIEEGTLIEEEQKARDHYAETIRLSRKKFHAMMIIDGCFIIEFFYRYAMKREKTYSERGRHDIPEGRDGYEYCGEYDDTGENDSGENDSTEGRDESACENVENDFAENDYDYDSMDTDSAENNCAEGGDENDPVMQDPWIRNSIKRDLLLLENQLPFFVLSKLYRWIKSPDEPDDEFIDVAAKYLKLKTPSQSQEIGETDHLLHLYHKRKTSGLSETDQVVHVSVMPSAAELKESGVRFEAVVGELKLGEIKFKNGTLQLPVLYVHDDTESKFRNLIAYEQHRQERDIDYFTDYVKFMDCLINSSKDVVVLCHAKIIKNYLGNDEVVAEMFNKMCVNVLLHKSYYSKIYQDVNMHHGKRIKVWMAKLRREYFHSPWAFLSVVAAIVLLLLTAAQTVFTVLSYTNQS